MKHETKSTLAVVAGAVSAVLVVAFIVVAFIQHQQSERTAALDAQEAKIRAAQKREVKQIIEANDAFTAAGQVPYEDRPAILAAAREKACAAGHGYSCIQISEMERNERQLVAMRERLAQELVNAVQQIMATKAKTADVAGN